MHLQVLGMHIKIVHYGSSGEIAAPLFRSTSESRPNSIEGKNVRPPVRTSVRPYVRPSVRPSTKSFFNLNEIWYIGRGRWLLHDDMPYGRIEGQGQKCWLLKFFFFPSPWNSVYRYRSMSGARRYAVWPDRRSRSRPRALQSLNSFHFQHLSPPPFTTAAGKWPLILKLGHNI